MRVQRSCFPVNTAKFTEEFFQKRIPVAASYKTLHAFYKQHFYKGEARLKLAKNEANAKQHPKAEFLLFENDSHSSSKLKSKNDRAHSKE